MTPNLSLDRLNAVEIDPELMTLAIGFFAGARRRPRASNAITACTDAYLDYYGIEDGAAMREAAVEGIGALLARMAAWRAPEPSPAASPADRRPLPPPLRTV